MKRFASFLLFFHLLFIFNPLAAQESIQSEEVTSLFKINFLLPGISFEQKLTRLSTLNLDTYMDALLIFNETSKGSFSYFFTPSLKFEYRSYYNLKIRNKKGRQTVMNNGNYFAPVYIGRYSPTTFYGDKAWVSQLAGVWGIHRNSHSGFSFDLNAGIVYTFNTDLYTYYSLVAPIVQIRLGYYLGRKINN